MTTQRNIQKLKKEMCGDVQLLPTQEDLTGLLSCYRIAESAFHLQVV